MAAPIDPPRTPQAPAALVLAQAALQRQGMLQDALAPKGGAAPPEPQPVPLAAGNATPAVAQADQLHLSTSARASLGEAANAALASGKAVASPTSSVQRTDTLAASMPTAPAPTTVTGAAWSVDAMPAPVRQLLGSLLQQLPMPGGRPVELLAAHPWPPAMASLLDAGSNAPDPHLPALRTWLVAQGQVHTAQGQRPLTLTLRLPQAWLQAAGALQPAAAQPLVAAFAGPPQRLESGLFALALQLGGPTPARTSALLMLEFAPQTAPLVYGRESVLARVADPWLQLAALQASGQWRDLAGDEDELRERPMCNAPGCPYEGRASCVQPFCLALRVPPLPDRNQG